MSENSNRVEIAVYFYSGAADQLFHRGITGYLFIFSGEIFNFAAAELAQRLVFPFRIEIISGGSSAVMVGLNAARFKPTGSFIRLCP